MRSFDLYTLRTTFESQGVMMCFNGPFSHSVIEQLGDAVKNHLRSSDAPRSRVTDVFSVFVEQAQNLKNYTTARLDGIGTLAIARDGERYVVSSGNMILPEDKPQLQSRLDEIVSADADTLKLMYKTRLREPLQDGAGAGLGLLTMARTATDPIEYSILDSTGNYNFFTITVTI
ncbi:MAG TPA: SiaB family protein kinase [Alkalispirochaeta sp.]|nr:SiaB family protein kinase [Alkalispirochaeta sp.]